jgi:hypothetical protein
VAQTAGLWMGCPYHSSRHSFRAIAGLVGLGRRGGIGVSATSSACLSRRLPLGGWGFFRRSV